ncbi:hypothetical protein Slin15195_G063480 [Septoria linicola]|uniref:Uncharacterized protein n=1 Tax=Septoria linicola TaxID=215465 RepID=A0A9Q9APF0_9PEZI|nr:hypothetical protein Slin14017_G113790 [Septoria linicola]USW53029.1 hypothetical protein Slin15195_G063480 [Septoria linicola]
MRTFYFKICPHDDSGIGLGLDTKGWHVPTAYAQLDQDDKRQIEEAFDALGGHLTFHAATEACDQDQSLSDLLSRQGSWNDELVENTVFCIHKRTELTPIILNLVFLKRNWKSTDFEWLNNPAEQDFKKQERQASIRVEHSFRWAQMPERIAQELLVKARKHSKYSAKLQQRRIELPFFAGLDDTPEDQKTSGDLRLIAIDSDHQCQTGRQIVHLGNVGSQEALEPAEDDRTIRLSMPLLAYRDESTEDPMTLFSIDAFDIGDHCIGDPIDHRTFYPEYFGTGQLHYLPPFTEFNQIGRSSKRLNPTIADLERKNNNPKKETIGVGNGVPFIPWYTNNKLDNSNPYQQGFGVAKHDVDPTTKV